MNRNSMTVVVPIYNEIDNLDRLYERCEHYRKSASIPVDYLLIDDGSSDGSREKIEAICQKEGFNALFFDRNYGLSSAIKAGIDRCQKPLIGYIDADLQTTPDDFEKLLAKLPGHDAVVGYRAKRKDTLAKRLQSKLANAIRRQLIDDGIIDTGCPLKIIRTEMAKTIPFFDGMHRFIPALVQLYGGKVAQVEVRHFERVAGESKFNIFNRSIRPLQDLFAYRWMKSRHIHYRIERQCHE